jgi:phenylacetate-coenzyme A ligase PaaK-like adenylate-forming protein
VLYGKPTYLLDLRTALIGQGMDRAPWQPRLLLVSGEPLHPDDRARLTGYFGAPVVDALASTEGGLIAATRPDGRTYRVFGENVRLEVLDGSGRIAPSGRGELVLTNLVNRSTVFARYRTGDLAELETAPDGSQRLLQLRGREPETVRFRTGEVPADEVTRVVGFLPGLADFQFVVRGRDRTAVRWSAEASCSDTEALEAALRQAVSGLLPGEDLELEQCARITPLGGKKRRFLL